MADVPTSGGSDFDSDVDVNVTPQGGTPAQPSTQTPTKPAPSPTGSERGTADIDEPAAAGHTTDLPAEDKQTLGKLQQEQAEKARLAKELSDAKKDLERLRVIEENALKSPDKFRKALIDYSGWDEQSADAYIDQIKRSGQAPREWYGGQTPPTQPGQPAAQGGQVSPSIDPFQAAEQVYNAKVQAERVQKAFFSRVPDLDPANLSPERHAGVRSLVTAIEYEARRRVMENPTADFVETLVDVYKDFTGKTDEQLETAREEGRTQGYLEANAARAGSTKSTKGVTPKESTYGLSPDQMQQAKAEGLSYERFAELVNSRETTVE